MNENSRRRSLIEMRWRPIAAAGQPNGQCPPLVSTWISIASLRSQQGI
jgi:hypothetical protein